MVNLDDYLGTQFVINLSSEAMENLELIYSSPNEVCYNTHSFPFANVVEEIPPPIAPDSPREQVWRVSNVYDKVNFQKKS